MPVEEKDEGEKSHDIAAVERHTLFLKGVSDTVEEEDLLQLFS